MDGARLYDRRNLSKREPVNWRALIAKFLLESRDGQNSVVEHLRHNFEARATMAQPFDLMKVI